MRRIEHSGSLPPPIRSMGLFSPQMQQVWNKYGGPEIWECTAVDELGKLGHLDECEFGVLIDREHGRYYLVAMSVDPDRIKTKIEDTPTGPDVVEDKSSKPSTVVYYTEINGAQYRYWQVCDTEMRREAIIKRARLGEDEDNVEEIQV